MKRKLITIILIVTVVIETSLLTYLILNNNNSIKNEDKNPVGENQVSDKNNIETTKEPIEWFNFEPVVETFGDNILLTQLKFTSPDNLFNEDFDESILIYDILSINNFEESRKIYLGAQAQQEYAYKFNLNEVQAYIKQKFNYEYSISELEQVFEFCYDEKLKSYISPPWTSSPVQVPPSIKEIYYKDGYYHIEFYHSLDKEKPGTMIIKKENDKYYLYSCTGINY